MFRTLAIGDWGRRLRSWFPDREFFMRSDGQVRFITVSSRLQMTVAGAVLFALLAWGGSLGAIAWSQYSAQSHRASLIDREAKVERSEKRVAAYRKDIGQVRDDLERRQSFLEDMVASLPQDVKSPGKVTNSRGEAAKTVSKVSMAVPESKGLAQVEARQLALVERLTHFADWRAGRAAAALTKLGLDPKRMLSRVEHEAMGGPFEQPSSEANGKLDPRFERLGLSLARMNALEQGLAGVPQVLPAHYTRISSGFGFRRDPFTGGGAMHKGLDFVGPTGTPILAAAKGTVQFVGQIHGYGNVVEIAHGNGVTTRYAHMSAFHAHAGELVKAGEEIGEIGSTGRSTGPHLHFEVRINGRAVNPRPFLEQAPDVLKEVHRIPRHFRR